MSRAIICVLNYTEKAMDAECRLKAGEQQKFCQLCLKWRWDDEECGHSDDERITVRQFEELQRKFERETEGRQRIYHFGDKCDERGRVSALCYTKPKPINMNNATWTTDSSAVTCRKCLAKLGIKVQAIC